MAERSYQPAVIKEISVIVHKLPLGCYKQYGRFQVGVVFLSA